LLGERTADLPIRSALHTGGVKPPLHTPLLPLHHSQFSPAATACSLSRGLGTIGKSPRRRLDSGSSSPRGTDPGVRRGQARFLLARKSCVRPEVPRNLRRLDRRLSAPWGTAARPGHSHPYGARNLYSNHRRQRSCRRHGTCGLYTENSRRSRRRWVQYSARALAGRSAIRRFGSERLKRRQAGVAITSAASTLGSGGPARRPKDHASAVHA